MTSFHTPTYACCSLLAKNSSSDKACTNALAAETRSDILQVSSSILLSKQPNRTIRHGSNPAPVGGRLIGVHGEASVYLRCKVPPYEGIHLAHHMFYARP